MGLVGEEREGLRRLAGGEEVGMEVLKALAMGRAE